MGEFSGGLVQTVKTQGIGTTFLSTKDFQCGEGEKGIYLGRGTQKKVRFELLWRRLRSENHTREKKVLLLVSRGRKQGMILGD